MQLHFCGRIAIPFARTKRTIPGTFMFLACSQGENEGDLVLLTEYQLSRMSVLILPGYCFADRGMSGEAYYLPGTTENENINLEPAARSDYHFILVPARSSCSIYFCSSEMFLKIFVENFGR